MITQDFTDGVTNVVNQLANKRNGLKTNIITADRISDSEMRAMLISGLGSKIIRLKTGYALNDTLKFETIADEQVYKRRIERVIKRAAKYMLAFGRGCIVVIEAGADHTKPLTGSLDMQRVHLAALSGDIIKGQEAELDLTSPRYMKPKMYQARGVSFHHSRVIDFTYVEPAEDDAPLYSYGGVSEFELIRSQFINDGIVERACSVIVEKNSTLFHKMKGFKESMRMGKDNEVVEYYATMAQLRGIYGDGLVDSEDDVISVAQTLTNLADVDQITLRRLAMVTGLPMSELIGEQPAGLGANGESEKETLNGTIENLQFDYLIEPIQRACALFEITNVEFKDNQGGTAEQRMNHEKQVIENAKALYDMGEDHRTYLQENEVLKKDDFAEMFPDD